jgi:hypothetical protein
MAVASRRSTGRGRFVSALTIARGRVLAIGDLDRLAAHRTRRS